MCAPRKVVAAPVGEDGVAGSLARMVARRHVRAAEGVHTRRRRRVIGPEGELPGAGQEGGVEEGDAGQPGEEGAVLDRIPCPVAAPPELDVGPVGTGHESDGQQHQAGQHVPAGDGQPVPHRPSQEGGDGHRRGHRQSDVAAVQEGRVVEHRRMAEDRRQPAAVDGGDGEGGEGAGHRHQQSQEDGRLQRQDRLGAAGQLREPPPQRPRRQEGPARQHPRPEEERARHAAPQPSQAVGPGGVPAGVVGHVDEGVVLAHEGPRQRRPDPP